MGQPNRPSCLGSLRRPCIPSTTHNPQRPHQADGIDGKTGIKLLVDIIKAPLPTRDSKGRKEPGSGGEASVPPLTRPIICICNDLYAPQLRGAWEKMKGLGLGIHI